MVTFNQVSTLTSDEKVYYNELSDKVHQILIAVKDKENTGEVRRLIISFVENILETQDVITGYIVICSSFNNPILDVAINRKNIDIVKIQFLEEQDVHSWHFSMDLSGNFIRTRSVTRW